MANVFTALQPILFSAARVVGRELTGFSAAVDRNFNDKNVALGDTVKVPVVPALTSSTTTTSNVFPTGADRTLISRDLTLNQASQVTWHTTAEQERSLGNGGNADDVFGQTVEQGIRTLTNEIEAYLGVTADLAATRARGIAGTDPFASNLNMTANMKKVLDDLGAPQIDRSIVTTTTSGASIRNQITAGMLLGSDAQVGGVRAGEILNLNGFSIKESAGIATHTAGTGTGYLVDGALVAGNTAVTVDTGSGTILAGDAIGFAGSTDYYGVKTALSGSDLVIQDPGLAAAVADDDAIAVVGTHTASMALQRSALVSVVRPALQPIGGGVEQMTITDSQTGWSFLLLRVVQDGQVSYFMRVVYDAFAPNPEFLAKIIG